MDSVKRAVVTFHSTSHAIQAEKACRAIGVEVKLIPTPRHISSDCGVALRFDYCERERVVAALAEKNVEISLVASLD